LLRQITGLAGLEEEAAGSETTATGTARVGTASDFTIPELSSIVAMAFVSLASVLAEPDISPLSNCPIVKVLTPLTCESLFWVRSNFCRHA